MGDFEEKVRAAFESELKRTPARPELRQRVIANAVATPRARQSWFGGLTPPRMAMVAAAAAVLVVAGVGLRVATQGGTTIARKSPKPPAATLAFGKLPTPGLHPSVQGGGGPGATSSVIPYFGPATMTWSGQLPKQPSSAPVYRFTLPTPADADAFASRLAATRVSAYATERNYTLPGGYQMSIAFTDPVAGEPTFVIYRSTGPSAQQPLGDAGARAAADAELARLRLTPPWQFGVTVSSMPMGSAPEYIIQYQRLIQVSSGVMVGEVDGNGDPSGIQMFVDSNGKAARIAGVLRLAEQPATYPLRAASSVVSDALKAAPITPASGPTPEVSLTKATLVYTAVSSGNIGYLEPAYLFTGTFTQNGITLEKRVLVPALAPPALS